MPSRGKPTKPAVRADRQEGLGRRWVIISKDHRLKLWRWIEREKAQKPFANGYTINGAMSKFLADAIEALPE